RREHPRSDLDQRSLARMSDASLDPVALAAALIRRPSVTPKDEGALDIVAAALEQLAFTCHRLVFGEDGAEPIHNLYARWGDGRPNPCFARHSEGLPAGALEFLSFGPVSGAVCGGAVWRRGGVDMEGAIAAVIGGVEAFFGEGGRGNHGSNSLL